MHHYDAIAHAQHFRHLGGDQNDAQAIGFELIDELVDLFLRPDVDATGRLIEDTPSSIGNTTSFTIVLI